MLQNDISARISHSWLFIYIQLAERITVKVITTVCQVVSWIDSKFSEDDETDHSRYNQFRKYTILKMVCALSANSPNS